LTEVRAKEGIGGSAAASAVLHGAVLLSVLVAFPAAKIDPAPLVAIPVDLATPSEVTRIKAGSADAKDEAPLAGKPQEKKPEAVKEANKTPEKTAEAAPSAEPTPEAKPKTDPPKEAPKSEAKKPDPKPAKPKQAAVPKKPAPAPDKKPGNETDRVAALLNKIPNAANEPAPVLPADEARPSKVKGQSNGTEAAMSVNEIDALRARIAQCWNPPPGGLGADQIVVKLRLQLNQDGTLVGYPTVANSGSSPFFQPAAESAVRAVFQCQPYALPSDKYELWRDMILNFDPSEMYRAG
jgi:outer membrane biosynthesis protein TonB